MTAGHGFGMGYTANFASATVDYDCNRGDEALRVFEEDKIPRSSRSMPATATSANSAT